VKTFGMAVTVMAVEVEDEVEYQDDFFGVVKELSVASRFM
jgi:hypothetical protein